MGKKTGAVLILFLLVNLAAGRTAWAQSPVDSLLVEPTLVQTGQSTFSLNISLVNSVPVSGISGRIVFDGNLMTPIDIGGGQVSMDVIGRGTALPFFGANIQASGAVTFALLPDFVPPLDQIGPGRGLICRINFTVRTPSDTTTCVRLEDDATPGSLEPRNQLSDNQGVLIIPSLGPGSVQFGGGSPNGACTGGPPPPPPGGNQPPVINPIAAQTVPQGSILSFAVRASDPDGDNVTLSATALPQNASFTTVTGDSVVSGTFTFAPSLSQLGNFTATFRAVDDSGAAATLSVTINVTAVNKDILFSSSVTGKAPTGAVPGKRPALFPIDLTARDSVFGVQFDLAIDTSVLQLDSIVPTQRLDNFLVDFRNLGGRLDRFRVLAFSVFGDKVRSAATPTIMNLAFSVSPLARPGKTAVVIDSGWEATFVGAISQSMLTESGEFFIDRFGDANLDTLVNVADVVALVGFILGKISFSMRQFDAANTNRDSAVNVVDLVNIVNLIFGIPIPPAPQRFEGPPAELALNSAAFAADPNEPILLEAKLPTEIAGMQVHVAYDPKEMSLNLPVLTPLSNGMILKSHDDRRGRLNLVIHNLGGTRKQLQAGDGVILKIPATRLSGFGDKQDPQIAITGAVLATPQAAEVPVKGAGGAVPRQFALYQNYPNPFNPRTTIRFSVGAQRVGDQTAVPVKLQIYNLLGQAVKKLVDDTRAPGLYSVEWDGTDLRGGRVSSGIYFYRLVSGKFSETKKMMFLK